MKLLKTLSFILCLLVMSGCNLADSSQERTQPIDATTPSITSPAGETKGASADVTSSITSTVLLRPTATPVSTGNAASGKTNVPAIVAPSAIDLTSCRVQSDWPTYTVASGDSLSLIANNVKSSTAELTQANCLANPDILSVGTILHVPQIVSAPVSQVSVPVSQPAVSVPVAGQSDCLAQTYQLTEMYSWANGTGAVVVAQPSANINLPVIAYQQYNQMYQVNFNDTLGWVEGRSVTIIGDCSRLIPVEFQALSPCIVLLYKSSSETNLLPLPNSGTPLAQFPAGIWVEVVAYNPEGYYQVRLMDYNGTQGWVAVSDFLAPFGKTAGPCQGLPRP